MPQVVFRDGKDTIEDQVENLHFEVGINSDKEHLRHRLLYYGASMIHTQLHSGDSYGKMVPAYVICFMNFRLKHDTDKLIYHYLLRVETGESYSSPNILDIYLCELPRLASKPGKSLTPVEVWFDILQNMRNFVCRPERYGAKYDSIFESSLQSPIPDTDKLQYFRSMFDDDVRSYLTDEDREEIAQEFYAKGIEQGVEQGRVSERLELAKSMKSLSVPVEIICQATGLTADEVAAL